jgi:hypothetical protein
MTITATAGALGAPRWRGERGRAEVWYATFTDVPTGVAGWVHCEIVAPVDGGAPYAHGWAAVFRAGAAPRLERFGPSRGVEPRHRDGEWFAAADVVVADGVLRGCTETLAWNLSFVDDSPPLFTFPRLAWDRQLLPGAQIVPWPRARFTGKVVVGAEVVAMAGAEGAVARIFGHGSPQRWGWLHAPLGDGAIEVVAATARRPGLRRLPPLAMVQVRLPGERDWPRNPAVAAPRFRTRLRSDGFSVRGAVGGRRLAVDVVLPTDQRVELVYTDPDGSTATCSNSERASATVVVENRGGAPSRWHLDARAHAEVGTRP